jgi:urease
MSQPGGKPTRETDSSSITRAYRLQKRRRPCDQCRERKLRCQAIDERPPCPRCAQAQVDCTFRGKASQNLRTPRPGRQRLPSQRRGADLGETSEHIGSSSVHDTGHESDSGLEAIEQLGACSSSLRDDCLDDTPVSNSHLTDLDLVHSQSSHQYLQTLDDPQDQVAVLLGPSSESDPWLLRHARFDEYGQRAFHGQQHFRNIGGVPTTSKIPVHFFVAPNSICESVASSTRISEKSQLLMRLTELIAPELGARLVRL